MQNVRLPINASVMHKVFTLHAPVLRLVVFEKASHLFCLAEFETIEHATKCVNAMHVRTYAFLHFHLLIVIRTNAFMRGATRCLSSTRRSASRWR